MMKPVFTALHKSIKGTRKNQCCRRIVTEKNNLSVQDLHCCTIWPFRCLILRKRRISRFYLSAVPTYHCQKYHLFYIHPDCFLYSPKAPPEPDPPYRESAAWFWIGHLSFFPQPHSAVPDSFSDQRGICFYRVENPSLEPLRTFSDSTSETPRFG